MMFFVHNGVSVALSGMIQISRPYPFKRRLITKRIWYDYLLLGFVKPLSDFSIGLTKMISHSWSPTGIPVENYTLLSKGMDISSGGQDHRYTSEEEQLPCHVLPELDQLRWLHHSIILVGSCHRQNPLDINRLLYESHISCTASLVV